MNPSRIHVRLGEPEKMDEVPMAISQKQKVTALKQAKLAASGDPKAIKFFADIRANSPDLAKEYDALLDGGSDVVGGIKRTDLKTDTKSLSPKQFKIGVSQAIAAKENQESAVLFFASMEKKAADGDTQSRAFLGIRDEIKNRTPEEIQAAQQGTDASKPAPVGGAPQPAQRAVQNQNAPPARRAKYSPSAVY